MPDTPPVSPGVLEFSKHASCPYCPKGNKTTVRLTDGSFVCPTCGHIIVSAQSSLKCTCIKCWEIEQRTGQVRCCSFTTTTVDSVFVGLCLVSYHTRNAMPRIRTSRS